MIEGTLIIGAGAIGLSLGWRLLQRGEPVTILERGEAARQASWAATGLLSSVPEFGQQADTGYLLGRESLALYPEFASELEQASGVALDFRQDGALALAVSEEELHELRHYQEYLAGQNLPVAWLAREQVREREPAVVGSVWGALHRHRDCQIDARRLGAALKAVFLKSGGILQERCEVTEIRLAERGPPTVLAGGREWSARRLVLAAGSWSGLIPALADALGPLVRPVKGQVLALTMPRADFVRCPMRTPHIHITPKDDSRLFIGATVEEAGFNTDIVAGAVAELIRNAVRAVPGVAAMAIREMWCGFRPRSRDGVPIAGELEMPGLYLATGNFRHGILHTPAMARLMCELILDGRKPELLHLLAPARFFS
ncbi:MAG: glycine oxidase ThiO [Candidatus Lambdaproteobacteria bacterium]|nr:glycine oxidase ThiO [Candidatus Lambdaproteobacteria bacterium]